jgi:hypothetical protein
MPSEKVIHCRRSQFRSITEIDELALSHVDFSEHLSMADGTAPVPALDTRVGLEWNENGLMVFFHGRFDKLRMVPESVPHQTGQKTPRLWEDSDVYEVFIGVNASASSLYKEFQVSPDGRFIDIDVNRQLDISNHHWYSGMQCRSIIDGEMRIWSSVIELPWECFGLHKRADDVWHANFYRASGTFHGDELLAWSPTGYGPKCFHRPHLFGTILFEQ